jgi:hypothetical protein
MLTFAEEILMLIVDDDEGVFLPIGKSTLDYALVGAVLMDLALADRIDTDLARLMVIDRTPTDNPMLDRVLRRIAEGESIQGFQRRHRDAGLGRSGRDPGLCSRQPGGARHRAAGGQVVGGDGRTPFSLPLSALPEDRRRSRPRGEGTD